MDWFERLTGFRENGYDETRRRLELAGDRLRSRVNGASYRIGTLDLVSLQDLRERAGSAGPVPGRLKLGTVSGNVRQLHRAPEFAGALFQVASQFNLLEMTSPRISPEHGVTRYQDDPTQGPACAIAAGAATIYRNYFVPMEEGVGGACGQTRARQLDGLAELGVALGTALGMPVDALWTMCNGYALCTADGLAAISSHLVALDPDRVDVLRGRLRIGLHRDVEVTDVDDGEVAGRATAVRPIVSQAFCSALPVAYGSVPRSAWAAFATLVLEAAYEATLLAGLANARRGVSNIVLLTRLGGGAFGNDGRWIDAAMERALRRFADCDLDVRIVSHGPPAPESLRLVQSFG